MSKIEARRDVIMLPCVECFVLIPAHLVRCPDCRKAQYIKIGTVIALVLLSVIGSCVTNHYFPLM